MAAFHTSQSSLSPTVNVRQLASSSAPTILTFNSNNAARTAAEAQTLYNHIRTAALALDSLFRTIPLPFLQQLPPALDVGLESILGFLLPVVGDLMGSVLGLYIVFCCWLFGSLGAWTLGQMVSLFICLALSPHHFQAIIMLIYMEQERLEQETGNSGVASDQPFPRSSCMSPGAAQSTNIHRLVSAMRD
jgi:hypothetical protein